MDHHKSCGPQHYLIQHISKTALGFSKADILSHAV
jgi:hypothetical protein